MRAFIRESNKIEGISREPTKQEEAEYSRFMGLNRITIKECKKFTSAYQPDAGLRDKVGMNVRVGNYLPPKGGEEIVRRLYTLLDDLRDHTPFENHLAFESLHPFTDCNGRLGRMIWMWQMRDAQLGFLHHFYYQSLSASRQNG